MSPADLRVHSCSFVVLSFDAAARFAFFRRPIRKAIWKLWYPFLTRRLRDEDVLFLNYAFETEPPMAVPLTPGDETNRACIQLSCRGSSRIARFVL